MKTIGLLRHAKSSWKNASLTDIQRPLKKRGLNDSNNMAPVVAFHMQQTALFVSPALRARETAEPLPYEATIEDALYTFEAEDLESWLKALDDSLESVLIVGHNPALTILASDLSQTDVDYVSTCTFLQLVSSCEHWQELFLQPAELKQFISPKML